MGGLTVEVQGLVAEHFKKGNGFLVNISDWQEANRVSGLIDRYCKECGKCLATAPVISLGEVKKDLKDSGLFAVGLLDIDNKKECPAVESFQ
jgi:hypothetical protein